MPTLLKPSPRKPLGRARSSASRPARVRAPDADCIPARDSRHYLIIASDVACPVADRLAGAGRDCSAAP